MQNIFSIVKQKDGDYLKTSTWPLLLDPARVLATAPRPYVALGWGHPRSHSCAVTRILLGVNVCVSKWAEAATRRSDSHIRISFHTAEGEKT